MTAPIPAEATLRAIARALRDEGDSPWHADLPDDMAERLVDEHYWAAAGAAYAAAEPLIRAPLEAEVERLRAQLDVTQDALYDAGRRRDALRAQLAEAEDAIGDYEAALTNEQARIIAAITDPERYAAWCQAAWDDGQHVVQAAPSVLAGVAAYVAAVAGDDGTIPCQVYRMGPHGKRLCVRAINEAPLCCFPGATATEPATAPAQRDADGPAGHGTRVDTPDGGETIVEGEER